MKQTRNVVAVLMFLVGIVWILQGANILPGSFMTGQIQWLIIGIVVAVIGGGILVLGNRRGKSVPPAGGSDADS